MVALVWVQPHTLIRTDFNLPDTRGMFLRGVDQRTVADGGRDPDIATRTVIDQEGDEKKDVVGSIQQSCVATHNHPLTDPGHGHPIVDPTHAHPINDPSHAHGVHDPDHRHHQPWGHQILPGDANHERGNHRQPNGAMTDVAHTGIAIHVAMTGITVTAVATGVTVTPQPTGITIASTGGTETRPINIAVHYIIRVR